ncbi:JAB domain-containing protein [Ligilactobacillus salivarius]|uniref:JAB domain-containing protein n=1 Tax=Ligilactobacillus salivarius TaxID=1624 RepID=UPI001CBAA4BD|nr:JAB domain-containing protein [Ligilactobacillus salivarius]MBZ4030964.1 JAB domain-containing protein [Ligilactobacillus salivarius]
MNNTNETVATYKTNIEVKEIVSLKQVKIARLDWTVCSSFQLANKLIDEIGSSSQEILMVIGLNTKNEVNFLSKVFVGGINSATVEPGAIFQRLLLSNCRSFIIAHNHLSGEVTPSEQNINFTERIKKCGKILGIELIDSIIVGDEYYYSMAEEKQL